MYDLYEKKLKKIKFLIFFFKIDADHLSSNVIFSNLGQKILKLSLPVLWKRFEIKSHQRRARYLKPRRNGRLIPTGGGSRSPPPTLTRVKIATINQGHNGPCLTVNVIPEPDRNRVNLEQQKIKVISRLD